MKKRRGGNAHQRAMALAEKPIMPEPNIHPDAGPILSQEVITHNKTGLWRRAFGWEGLFRWDVFGVVVPVISTAIGLGMLTVEWFPHNLLIGQLCFGVAGFLCIIKSVGHAVQQKNDQLANRIGFAVVFSVLSAVLSIYMIQQIQKHKDGVGSLRITIGVSVRSTIAGPSLFWAEKSTTSQAELFPVNMILRLNLVNASALPIWLKTIDVQHQEGWTTWRSIYTVPEGEKIFFVPNQNGIADFSHARQLTFQDPTIQALAANYLEPKKGYPAIAFFTYPINFSEDSGGKYRIRMCDIEDECTFSNFDGSLIAESPTSTLTSMSIWSNPQITDLRDRAILMQP